MKKTLLNPSKRKTKLQVYLNNHIVQKNFKNQKHPLPLCYVFSF